MSFSVNFRRSLREMNSANWAVKTPQSRSLNCRGIPDAWLTVHVFSIIKFMFDRLNIFIVSCLMISSCFALSLRLLSNATIFCCFVSTKIRNQCDDTLKGKKMISYAKNFGMIFFNLSIIEEGEFVRSSFVKSDPGDVTFSVEMAVLFLDRFEISSK